MKNKRNILIILFILLGLNTFAQSNTRSENYYQLVGCDSTVFLCREEPWVLIFEDEFEGNSLDEDNWDVYVGVPRDPYFTSQKAWHQKENIVVNNGSLKIITRHEYKPNMQYIVSYNPLTYNISNFDYTSGELWSKRKFLFGKYEARVKIPKGWGLWPAFWLYGNGHYGNEIDVFEYWNEERQQDIAKIQHMTVHYDYDHDGIVEQMHYKKMHYKKIHNDMSSEYHIYTLIYLPGYIKWLVDGNTIYEYDRYFYNTIPLNPIGCELLNGQLYYQNLLYPFPPMNIIFNTAVQCGNGNEPNMNTVLPAQMEVDWFRYYVSANNALVQSQDIKQQYLTVEIHNGYAAYSVILDSITIPDNAKINIVALDEVKLLPGFKAERGSEVDISIYQIPITQTKSTITTLQNNNENMKISAQQKGISEIKIYPNPTSNDIIISCNEELVDNGEFLVFSRNGIILKKLPITEKSTTIVMDMPPEVYILAVRNIRTNSISSYKIIKK